MQVLVRVFERVERLPPWVRPIAYGPMLVLGMMAMRGAFVIGPVVLLVVLWKSRTPIDDLLNVIGVLMLALIGSALGGLFYSLLGRPIKRLPWIGPYLAGMIAVLPYVMMVVLIVRLTDGTPIMSGIGPADWFALGIPTVLFGAMTGHMFIREAVRGQL